MSLYLCIFGDGEEIEGVEVGRYSDFGAFRDTIVDVLESGNRGSRFPTLLQHPDSDGEWTPLEAQYLQEELETICIELRALPPIRLEVEWKRDLVRQLGLRTACLYDCFFDVDGEPLIERLIHLARVSQERRLPISFQ